MKIMTCPLNGPRDISEFIRGREVREMPDPSICSDETWAAHLPQHGDLASEVVEWWKHTPTSYWFIARRNTATGEIIATYTVDDFFGASTAAADAGMRKIAA